MTETDLTTTSVVSSATIETAPTATRSTSSAKSGLSAMVLPELRSVASGLGIKDASGMRKGDLIAAIKERQGAGSPKSEPAPIEATKVEAPKVEAP